MITNAIQLPNYQRTMSDEEKYKLYQQVVKCLPVIKEMGYGEMMEQAIKTYEKNYDINHANKENNEK